MPKEGDFIQIDMGDGWFGWGRILPSVAIGFYDYRSECVPSLDLLKKKPFAFTLFVMRDPLRSGRWPVIGHLALEEHLRELPEFFTQDPINGKITITDATTDEERAASRDECKGIERLAVWSDTHIEDRLRDHFAGRPNKWVESLRLD